MKQLFIFIFIVSLVGCAGGQSSQRITIDKINRNMIITDIASGAQMPFPGGTNLDAEGNIPVEGLLSPLAIAVDRSGLENREEIHIGEVGGSLIIQSALRGAQNVDIPNSLGAIFVPSTQPWQIEFKQFEIDLYDEDFEYE